ncbi:uncharacterized protein MYCFIDRAFT_84876 [Pseudocercospora fijiensis CIRAD86]|uniref:Uncharacterized protein n=1 Tax=Pseudocercospora fijiensis (strain CIRAD86) TaxID=383855 RepID=M3B1B0_PSEFD|nr:uncharacterized protein MYCFIDRAFT_84876 [Pseudocercospora fijiensis CIRAD86]EME83202.1 hypothetical protein MYCFIDRAFT_84876 [Pseudocercospora fijiensis CIRAD86]
MERGDLSVAPLSYEAGIDDINTFYASPEPEPVDQQLEVADTMSVNHHTHHLQQAQLLENQLAAVTDIENLPEQAVFSSTLESSANPTFFHGGLPPNPYSPVETSSHSSLMRELKRSTRSPGATQARSASDIPNKKTTKNPRSVNDSETPANRTTARDLNPSSDRSQLQAEMRTEEKDGDWPVQDSPPLPRLDLRAGTKLDHSPLSSSRSRDGLQDLEYSALLSTASNAALLQSLKRNRQMSSPLSGDVSQRKKAKVTALLSTKSPQALSNTELQSLQCALPTAVTAGTTTVPSRTLLPLHGSNDRPTMNTEDGSPNTTNERKDPTPMDRPAAKSNEPKNREKGIAKQEAGLPYTSGAVKRPPRHSLSERELKELGGIVSNADKQSPRKTRIQRTVEQESRPNAVAAAKRRHSTNPKT